MTPFISFFTAIGMAASIGTIMIIVFRRPLKTMLSETCATEARSQFWTTYLSALFMMVPVVAASLFALFANAQRNPVAFLEGAFLFAAGGLLVALVIVGRNIAGAIAPMVAPATSNSSSDAPFNDPATPESAE